jgi:hypothetical protein
MARRAERAKAAPCPAEPRDSTGAEGHSGRSSWQLGTRCAEQSTTKGESSAADALLPGGRFDCGMERYGNTFTCAQAAHGTLPRTHACRSTWTRIRGLAVQVCGAAAGTGACAAGGAAHASSSVGRSHIRLVSGGGTHSACTAAGGEGCGMAAECTAAACMGRLARACAADAAVTSNDGALGTAAAGARMGALVHTLCRAGSGLTSSISIAECTDCCGTERLGSGSGRALPIKSSCCEGHTAFASTASGYGAIDVA